MTTCRFDSSGGAAHALLECLDRRVIAVQPEPAGLTWIGLPDEFVHRLRDRIRPGTSALFLLAPTLVTDRVRQTLGAAELIQTVFSPEEAVALRRDFAELPA